MSREGAKALGAYIGSRIAEVEQRNRAKRRARIRAKFKAARPMRVRPIHEKGGE